jgi:hypothetical protein
VSRKGLLIGGVQKGIESIDDVDSEGGGGEVEEGIMRGSME